MSRQLITIAAILIWSAIVVFISLLLAPKLQRWNRNRLKRKVASTPVSFSQGIFLLNGAGETIGPFQTGELIQMQRKGKCDSAAMAWQEGAADWVRLDSLVNFSGPAQVVVNRGPGGMIVGIFGWFMLVGGVVLIFVPGIGWIGSVVLYLLAICCAVVSMACSSLCGIMLGVACLLAPVALVVGGFALLSAFINSR